MTRYAAILFAVGIGGATAQECVTSAGVRISTKSHETCQKYRGTWRGSDGAPAAAPERSREHAGLGAVFCKLEDINAESAPAAMCADYWRAEFRNPKEFYVHTAMMIEDQKGGVRVALDARAQNGYGGFNGTEVSCALDETGSIDATETDRIKDTWRLFQTGDNKLPLAVIGRCEVPSPR